MFSVDRKQKLLGAFNCSLSDNMLSPGRLYIFEECLGFYSSLPPTSMKARAQRTDARPLRPLLPLLLRCSLPVCRTLPA